MIGLTHNGLVTVGAFSAAVAVLGLGGLALCAWLYDRRERRRARALARLDPEIVRRMTEASAALAAHTGVSFAEASETLTKMMRLYPRAQVRNIERSIDVEAR